MMKDKNPGDRRGLGQIPMSRRRFIEGGLGILGALTWSAVVNQKYGQVPREEVQEQVLLPNQQSQLPLSDSDAIPSPLREHAEALASISPSAITDNPAPDYLQNAEVMLGKLGLKVIVVQSNSNLPQKTEQNLTQEQLNKIDEEMAQSISFWQRNAPEEANFNPRLLSRETVTVNYEPINMSQPDEGLWIAEAMTKLGIPGDNHYDQVHRYNHKLRQELGLDWVVTMFIVPSFNDDDGRFAKDTTGRARGAYMYIGGPFGVSPTKPGGYTFDELGEVVAHELGHIGAYDLYPGAAVPCDRLGGYLGVKTGNSKGDPKGPCEFNEPSLMDSITGPFQNNQLDPDSRGQVGWQRQNVSGQFPLVAAGRIEQDLRMNGNVLEGTIKIRYALPGNGARPFNINRFEEAFVMVDGKRINLIPDDGAVDGHKENVHAIIPPSLSGNARIGLRGYVGGTAFIPMNVPVGDFPKVFLPVINR
jgi:hypothetical protein